jgi:methyl coenzyme M reductase subunit C-like uncharacterized protein (methanogenesis marker protein 7)
MSLKDAKEVDFWGNDIGAKEWEEHWVSMPEFNNVVQPKPAFTALFKFRNKNDFDKFHELVKEFIYNNERVFDGMQKKKEKQAWYPLSEKASKYNYV